MIKIGRLRGAALIRTGSLIILLSAVFPNTLYIGHGPTSFQHAHAAEQAHSTPPDGGEHAQHCHTGPSRCGGAQSMVGTWWAGEDAGLLSLHSPSRAVQTAEHWLLGDPLSGKKLQPPRHRIPAHV